MAHVDLTHSSNSSDTDSENDLDVESLLAEVVRLRQENQFLMEQNHLLRFDDEKLQELHRRFNEVKEQKEDAEASAKSRAKQAYKATKCLTNAKQTHEYYLNQRREIEAEIINEITKLL